jgi:hypothetical protein
MSIKNLPLEPDEVVRAFLIEYTQWNDASFARYQEGGDPWVAIDEAEQTYQQLLDKFCRPGFAGEPVSYSSHSSHDPELETIEDVRVSGASAVVETLKVELPNIPGAVSRREYRLSFDEGRWYIEAVDFIDADGSKYPGL